MFLIFIHVAFCTTEMLYSLFSLLQQSSISVMLQSWIQIRRLLWLIISQARWSFIILVNFSCYLFSRDFYEFQWLFSFQSQQEWSESNAFGFHPGCFMHIRSLYYFFSSIQKSSISGMIQSWQEIRRLLWLILLLANISTSTLALYCGKHNGFLVGKILFSIS